MNVRSLTRIMVFAALLLVSGGSVAHAQTDGTICDFTDAGSQDGTYQNGHCVSNGTYGFNNTSGTYAQNVSANAAADNTTAEASNCQPDPGDPTVCYDVNSGDNCTCPATANSTAQTANTPTNPIADTGGVLSSVIIWIMSIFAWLVGVAAMELDYSVYYLVVTMGNYVHNLSAVGVAWRILRDVGNIALIFGFIAVGISVILNNEWYGGKKLLPRLILTAIFLNFSMFFSEAIIDMGNLVAIQFYTQINGGQPAAASGVSAANEPISNAIMNQLGLQTLYNVNGQGSPEWAKNSNALLIGFLGIILFIVTAFVLFALAFMLLSRFVILIMLIMASSIGFVSFAVPQMNSLGKKWWNMLVQQTITAPVLMLLLYVALAVITDVNFLTGFSATSGGFLGFVNVTNLTGFAGTLLSFLVAMGLLLFVVMAAQHLGATGAKWATSTAGRMSFGATSWALTRTAGAGSRMLAQRMRNSRLNNSMVGRTLIRGAEYGSKASFDVRNTGVFKRAGVSAGKVQEGGYQGARDRAAKAHEGWVKATDAAVDERDLRRGVTESDEQKAAEGAANLANAEQVRANAVEKHATAEKEHAQYLAEIQRIQAEKVTYAAQQRDKEARLEAARTKAETAKANVAAAEEEVTTAKNNLAEVTSKVKDKSGKMKDAAAYQSERVGAEKKQQKLGYAESISSVGGLLSGAGSTDAARKIIRDANKKKSDEEDLLDKLKKAVAKEEEKPKDSPKESE